MGVKATSETQALAQTRLNISGQNPVELDTFNDLVTWCEEAEANYLASNPGKEMDGFRLVLIELVRYYKEGNPAGAKFGDPMQRNQHQLMVKLNALENLIKEGFENIQVIAVSGGAAGAAYADETSAAPIDDDFFNAMLGDHRDSRQDG